MHLAQARSRMLDAAQAAGLTDVQCEVLFSGVEEGRVEAALRVVPPGQHPALTGLESSVVDGDGFGIEPFRAVVRPRRYITSASFVEGCHRVPAVSLASYERLGHIILSSNLSMHVAMVRRK